MIKIKASTNIHIEKNKIRLYFYLGSLLPLVLLSFILSSVYLNSLKKEHSSAVKQLSTSILFEKKLELRNSVERTIYMIDNLRTDIANQHSTSALTQEQINIISIETISKYIRNLRLTNKDGYIWVNHIIDYKGGDDYAVKMIHPNLPHTEGMKLSTNMTDIKGNKFYEIELNGINKNGELYFGYYSRKINSEKTSRKMSFAKLYKPYDWVIAAGIYMDDMDELIESENREMQEVYNRQKYISLTVVIITFIVLVIIMIFFEKNIGILLFSYENEIASYTNRLEELSRIDQLTGLYNRLQLDDTFMDEMNKAKRYNKQFSIIMVDLDKFKSVNDTYGHQVGDSVLKELATILQDNVRTVDTVGRWGGEEFLIICPETDIDNAKQLAEKIRKTIESHNFNVIGNTTGSFGVSSFHESDDKEKMIERADQALYFAKEQGRNKVRHKSL